MPHITECQYYIELVCSCIKWKNKWTYMSSNCNNCNGKDFFLNGYSSLIEFIDRYAKGSTLLLKWWEFHGLGNLFWNIPQFPARKCDNISPFVRTLWPGHHEPGHDAFLPRHDRKFDLLSWGKNWHALFVFDNLFVLVSMPCGCRAINILSWIPKRKCYRQTINDCRKTVIRLIYDWQSVTVARLSFEYYIL